jgi:hypothetical protein
MFFMHLRYDNYFHAVIFGMSVIFLGIFIWFTMYDTDKRGQADPSQKERPANTVLPFKDGSRGDQELRKALGLPALVPGAPVAPPKALEPPR